MRYANQAAASLLGCASPEELLAQPLGAIFAQWESTHEDKWCLMVAEDVPSYKIVNGQPAEPLLTRIVNRETGEQRWRLVKAAPLRGTAGETMAVNIIEDVTEAKEAEQRQRFLAQAGRCSLSSLDYEETLQRVAAARGPVAGRLVRGRPPRRQPAPRAGRAGPRRPRQGRASRGSCAAATRPIPPRTRRPGVPLRAARSSTPRSRTSCSTQAIEDPEQLEAISALGMRSAMLVPMRVGEEHARRAHVRVGRQRPPFDEDDFASPGPRTPGRDRGRERAPVHGARRPRKRCRRACSPRAADHAGLGARLVLPAGDGAPTSAATSSTSSSSTRASSPSSATSPARA